MVKYYSILGMSVRCFSMRLTFESVGSSRLPSSMWVGLTLSVEGLNRTKRLILLRVRDNSPCLTAFQLEQWVFFLHLNLN